MRRNDEKSKQKQNVHEETHLFHQYKARIKISGSGSKKPWGESKFKMLLVYKNLHPTAQKRFHLYFFDILKNLPINSRNPEGKL